MADIIIDRINSRCFRRTGAEAPSLLLAATGIGPDREPNGRWLVGGAAFTTINVDRHCF